MNTQRQRAGRPAKWPSTFTDHGEDKEDDHWDDLLGTLALVFAAAATLGVIGFLAAVVWRFLA